MSESSVVVSRTPRPNILADAPMLFAQICRDYNVSINKAIGALMFAAELEGRDAAAQHMHTVTLYMVGVLVCEPGE
ncbi:hypothetical protein U1708_00200 [Sphingomonas sp. ZB1N12]|uniref:hypothetical protein n=1 Tax=Sphingomonas arabinosi TaxID=3096160 RepID=UPI002FCA9C0B